MAEEIAIIPNAHIIALSLLKDFYISYNETQYLSTQQVCKNRVFSVTNMDNSCEQFNNPTGWVQKKYTYKTQIPPCAFSIAYMDMSFEFLHSTLDQFKEFISKLFAKGIMRKENNRFYILTSPPLKINQKPNFLLLHSSEHAPKLGISKENKASWIHEKTKFNFRNCRISIIFSVSLWICLCSR
jgi:hypothetical protein